MVTLVWGVPGLRRHARMALGDEGGRAVPMPLGPAKSATDPPTPTATDVSGLFQVRWSQKARNYLGPELRCRAPLKGGVGGGVPGEGGGGGAPPMAVSRSNTPWPLPRHAPCLRVCPCGRLQNPAAHAAASTPAPWAAVGLGGAASSSAWPPSCALVGDAAGVEALAAWPEARLDSGAEGPWGPAPAPEAGTKLLRLREKLRMHFWRASSTSA